MIRQTIALSIALALVVPAAAGDRDIFNSDYLDLHKKYIEVLTKMAAANREGAAAGAGYYLCNTEAAEKRAVVVTDLCQAEESALAALVASDQLQTLKTLKQLDVLPSRAWIVPADNSAAVVRRGHEAGVGGRDCRHDRCAHDCGRTRSHSKGDEHGELLPLSKAKPLAPGMTCGSGVGKNFRGLG